MRIAVTSNDGITVNEHFGKAKGFYIFDIENGELKAIEKRHLTPYCQSENDTMPDPDHKFSMDKLSVIYQSIKDCTTLYTKQIGEKPEKELKQMGLQVKLCGCSIESLVECNGNCK